MKPSRITNSHDCQTAAYSLSCSTGFGLFNEWKASESILIWDIDVNFPLTSETHGKLILIALSVIYPKLNNLTYRSFSYEADNFETGYLLAISLDI